MYMRGGDWFWAFGSRRPSFDKIIFLTDTYWAVKDRGSKAQPPQPSAPQAKRPADSLEVASERALKKEKKQAEASEWLRVFPSNPFYTQLELETLPVRCKMFLKVTTADNG